MTLNRGVDLNYQIQCDKNEFFLIRPCSWTQATKQRQQCGQQWIKINTRFMDVDSDT